MFRIIDIDKILKRNFTNVFGCLLIFAAVTVQIQKKSSNSTFGFPTTFNPTIEKFAQNDHQHHTVPYSNLLHHVNNPRPVSTLLGLIRRV